MLELYKGRNQTFECLVEIEGASANKSIPRLIFKPNNDNKSIFFEGKIDKNKCKIEIPPLDINETGNVKLEIIVDDSLFSPWDSNYKIKEQITVESVSVKPTVSSIKVINDDITVNKKPIKKQTKSAKKEQSKLIKENATEKNKNLVKRYINEYKSKSQDDKSIIKEFASTLFEPKKETIRWGKSVLSDIDKDISKTIMYMYEK